MKICTNGWIIFTVTHYISWINHFFKLKPDAKIFVFFVKSYFSLFIICFEIQLTMIHLIHFLILSHEFCPHDFLKHEIGLENWAWETFQVLMSNEWDQFKPAKSWMMSWKIFHFILFHICFDIFMCVSYVLIKSNQIFFAE